LLPMMERIRPGSVQAIASCAELLRRDQNALEQLARTLYADAVSEGGGFVRISREKLDGQPQALVSRVLLLAICTLRGSSEDYFSVHIDSLAAMLGKEGTGDELFLPGGISAQRCYDELWLFCRESLCTEEAVLRLGANRIGKREVHASLCAPPLPPRTGGCEYVDAGTLAGELVLRTRREGDWLFPLGSGGRKKLKDYFIDKKVPRPLRSRMLLLCCGSEVLAVLGMCVSDRVKVTERTKEMLCLKFSESERG
ncbi:MAG: tRNA lysidine(34) synthetase TilS, partial [Clostridiales bacterium]|nr:tRNA lysidine(34) synthetase TilS [Clostridiales bacterium]